jgi:3-hydroxybutyryl-CoA dehydratase
MSFKVGDRKVVSVQVTDHMVRQYAEITGDKNPMHLDEEHAKTTRFGRRIAHGMLVGGLISRALAMELGHGGIYLSQSLKFLHPIFIDDVVEVELHVKSLREEKGLGVVETTVRKKGSDEIVIKGEAMIMRGDRV